jgi:Heterokaryon incompatibility protein (HET)
MIHCLLSTQSIANARPYEALSYCWGDESNKCDIILQGHAWNVTKNLFMALQQLRNSNIPRVLWVDALCINQSSKEEKNYQISLMPEIYSAAERVIAWMGEDDGVAYHCFQLFHQWGNAWRHLSPNGGLHQSIGSVFDVVSSTLSDTKSWKAAEDFFRRPYWTRMWVVQEAILGKHTFFQLGSEVLALMDLLDFSLLVSTVRSPENASFITSDQRLMVESCGSLAAYHIVLLGIQARIRSKQHFSYPYLLNRMLHLQCKDPRDRLYALLGLAKLGPSTNQILIAPDYNKPVADVYANFISSLIRSMSSLDMIAFAGTGNRRSGSTFDVPSWTIDLQSQIRKVNLYSIGGPFNCSYCLKPDFKVSIDNRTLRSTGVVYDSITAYRSDFISLYQAFVDCFALVSNWNELQHPTGLPWLQVFFRTFIMDTGGSTFGQEDTSKAEKNLFCNLAAGFSYVLGNLINAHTPVSTGTAFNDYVNAMDCWVRNPRPGDPDSRFKDEDEILGSPGGSIISEELLSWPFHEGSRVGISMMPAFLQKLNNTLRWSIFITTKGYIGIGPRLDIRIGDRICIVPGCRVPLIVRKVDDHYLLVGDTYVCGMMHGEVLDNLGNGEAELDTMTFL